MPESITNSVLGDTLTAQGILLCTIVSFVLGLCVAGTYMIKNKYSKGMVLTLALLPATVQVVIMLVNGNLGTGVAVMGAFSLVRFRSVPGSARDISSIFFAMAIGLATGMGYLFYAALVLVLIGAATLILTVTNFGGGVKEQRALKITIPENLDYDGLFDDLFEQYTDEAELDRVKTTNMGSMFELSYNIRLKDQNVPKSFIDELRCRNGNLNITIGRSVTGRDEL